MGLIHCCGSLHKTKTFALSPQGKYKTSEIDILKRCPICGCYVAQLTRISHDDKISEIRKTNAKGKKFLETLKNKIIYEAKSINYTKLDSGKFYLEYNEFGVKKRCYSNLSSLKAGRTKGNFEEVLVNIKDERLLIA